MIKNKNFIAKCLNPWFLITGLTFSIICLLLHLVYGSCQSTKYHYLVQKYYVHDYLPDFLIKRFAKNKSFDLIHSYYFLPIHPSSDYSGVWKTWYPNLGLESKTIMQDGRVIESNVYRQDGRVISRWTFYSKGTNKI